jgi:hypothetical protein
MHLNIFDLDGPQASRNAGQICWIGDFLMA